MQWKGHEKGMGIGGWLTNYKRFNCIPENRRMILTAGDYEHFDSYIGRKDIEYIASLGFDHVRLGFDQIVVEESPFALRERTVRLIDEFIGWCDEFRVNPVINLHKAIGNYCDVKSPVGLFDSEELQSRFVWLWTALAKRYAHNDNVAFELLNEVVGDAKGWNALWKRAVAEIRKVSPERDIVVGGGYWNNPEGMPSLETVDDPHVIYTFHCYFPHVFTHQKGVLQSDFAFYNRDMPYPCAADRYREADETLGYDGRFYEGLDKVDIRVLERYLAPAFDFLAAHPDKILWCGEFGTIRHANIDWRENYMNDVILLMKRRDIPYCVWNYLSTPNDGNRFSLVDDDTRRVLSPRLCEILLGNATEPARE